MEVEANFAVDKSKYFNKLDGDFGMLCLNILRDILFHVDSLSTPNEFWLRIEALFVKNGGGHLDRRLHEGSISING